MTYSTPDLSVDRNSNKEIIEDLFKDGSKVPVFDTRAYELPTIFWRSIKSGIEDYKQNKYEIDLYNRFFNKFVFSDIILEGESHAFYELLGKHMGMTDTEGLDYYSHHPELIDGLNEFNEKLYDHYRENGHRILVDLFIKNEKSKFSNFKRELVRKQYLEWDTLLTDEFYREDSDHITYPVLMIDRISLQVYSKEFLTYKSDVRQVVKSASPAFEREAKVERLMHQKCALSKLGYEQSDIDDYADFFLPADLDEKYDFMKHRSILPGFKLASIPEFNRNSYLWKTEGITYLFRHDPPKGAPISLFIFANMQRTVYNKMKEDIPEVEEAFDHELLDENNFIPMGYEKEYLKYEKQTLEELKDMALGTYRVMLEREGFSPGKVRSSETIFNINQIEICWNNELPLDTLDYLNNRLSTCHTYDFLNSSLHDSTPLLVTKYMSDIEPDVLRFAHKIYKKTKRNLRKEIVLGNELKLPADIGHGRLPIHTQFFTDPEGMKRYLYAKLIFHFTRRTTGFDKEKYQHGYHQWTKNDADLNETDKKRYLAAFLASSDLHKSFRDVPFFNSLADELRSRGFVTRKFFNPRSTRFFDKNVKNSNNFERMSRGKYRPKHGSYLENIMNGYLKLRDSLSTKT